MIHHSEPTAGLSRIFCVKYSGSVGIILRKLGVEDHEPQRRIQVEQQLREGSDAQLDMNGVQLSDAQIRLRAIVRQQNFTSFRPRWSWLPDALKICTFVTPIVADELELTVLHAIVVDRTERLELGSGDVIVSEEYEDLVTEVLNERSGETPRRNRPKFKLSREIPRLQGVGFDLEKLRNAAKEILHGTPSTSELINLGVGGPLPYSEAALLERQQEQYYRNFWPGAGYSPIESQPSTRKAHTEGSMPFANGLSCGVGRKNYRLQPLQMRPPTENDGSGTDGSGDAPPTPPPHQRTW